tara:strand:- start:235 stop:498 length:264 start_codon:yes stop_codon:yes gene_type:complete
MVEDKKAQQIQAGQEAKALLENPILVGAFNKVITEGYQGWVSTDINDSQTRESLFHQQLAILKVKNVLVQAVENGILLEQERKGGKK